jgi:hypothetical protein
LRIWDVPPRLLCRQHLLGEHRELHAIWVVLTRRKRGYRRHPETLRWVGKRRALYRRHELLVREMERRGYSHRSPLEKRFATGTAVQRKYLDSPARQREILERRRCPCPLDRRRGAPEGCGADGGRRPERAGSESRGVYRTTSILATRTSSPTRRRTK